MAKNNNKGISCFELFVVIVLCINLLISLYVVITESRNQSIIKSKSEGYSCICGEDGPLQNSKIALYYDESDNYVYCKIYASSRQVLSYPLYTEDGNKIKYINGIFIEDNTGKEVRVND